MMTISVDMHAPSRFCRREWARWLEAMLDVVDSVRMLPGQEHGLRSGTMPEHSSVDLIIACDGEIASVNARSLGCSGPTNILSFPEEGARLGSLFLSADALERESFLYGQEHAEHARRLLAHGIGHLTGFDHGPEMDDFCAMLEEAGRDALP